ncbi:hypothetical protein JCM5353_008772 [Sporobolomyces roseus]
MTPSFSADILQTILNDLLNKASLAQFNEPWADVVFEMHPQSASLLRTLRGRTEWASLVQEVKFTCIEQKGRQYFGSSGDSTDVLEEVIKLVPTLGRLTLVDPINFNEVDVVIRTLQQRRLQTVPVHLVLLKPFSKATNHWNLDASYSSIRTNIGDLTLHDTLSSILSSTRSLILQCSTNMHKFALSKFSNLERLELVSVPTSITGAVSLSGIFTNLKRLSSLKVLVVSGSPSPTLDLILSPTGIAKSVPASLATLSIQVEVGVDKIRRLVKSLPMTTKIGTLGIRSFEGNFGDLEVECERKRISLALV